MSVAVGILNWYLFSDNLGLCWEQYNYKELVYFSMPGNCKLSCHYKAEILLNVTLSHSQPNNQQFDTSGCHVLLRSPMHYLPLSLYCKTFKHRYPTVPKAKRIRCPARKPRVADSILGGVIYFHVNFSLVFLPYSSTVPL